jgi:hypothetical protein
MFQFERQVSKIFEVGSSLRLGLVSSTFASNLSSTFLCTINDNRFCFSLFLCSHMVSFSSSLLMSMSNLIWVNINIMDIKKHMLISLFISMLVGKEKEWDGYKIQGKTIWKVSKRGDSCYKRSEIGNEVAINCLWNCPGMTIQQIVQN